MQCKTISEGCQVMDIVKGQLLFWFNFEFVLTCIYLAVKQLVVFDSPGQENTVMLTYALYNLKGQSK